jgi:hypothetical protein
MPVFRRTGCNKCDIHINHFRSIFVPSGIKNGLTTYHFTTFFCHFVTFFVTSRRILVTSRHFRQFLYFLIFFLYITLRAKITGHQKQQWVGAEDGGQ